MPKKFNGENTKAVLAKAKKAALKEAETAKKQSIDEAEEWKDEDKRALKKTRRKEEKEKKRQEQLVKKAENRNLADEEEKAITCAKARVNKLTRAHLQSDLEKKDTSPDETHLTKPLEENTNRSLDEESSARNVDQAISVLSVVDPGQKMAETSVKAAFTSFEAAHMPRLKADNPTLRLSQLKQLLRKEWLRSNENPVNQRLKLKT